MAPTQITETVLVLSALRYSVDGNEGTSLEYVSADYLEGRDQRGTQVINGSGPVSLFDDLTVLPGIYTMTYSRGRNIKNAGGKRKTTYEPNHAELVEPLDLDQALTEVVAS